MTSGLCVEPLEPALPPELEAQALRDASATTTTEVPNNRKRLLRPMIYASMTATVETLRRVRGLRERQTQ
jgi:hypothetical protein